MKFVYVEPYVIPKQSLTGNNSERVDQRVLQVIYELPEERPMDVYIGQQMDVYLKAVPPSQSIAIRAGSERTRSFPSRTRRPRACRSSPMPEVGNDSIREPPLTAKRAGRPDLPAVAFCLFLGVDRRDDSKPDDLRGGRSLGDLIVEDQASGRNLPGQAP